MWKFEGINEIVYCGFPDGDYPVFAEYKKGKRTGKTLHIAVARHQTLGSSFLSVLGIRNREQYEKLKGHTVEVAIEKDGYDEVVGVDIANIAITLNGEYLEYSFVLESTEETDWDSLLAKRLGQPI
jgi:hypothetical protein